MRSRVSSFIVAIGGIGILLAGAAARAQDPQKDAQNKLLAKRAAEADCFRKLAETINGTLITSQTYVRDFVTESDQIRSDMDTFVKGVRLERPRYYEDGTCEVDGEVTVEKLIRHLEEVHKEHYKGNHIKVTDFERIRDTLQRDVIRVTGMGAPRPELPPDLPDGIEDVIEPLPPNYQPATLTIPAIWKTVTPQARLMAFRAAQLDAQRQLLERIKGLRLNSNTLVRDFVTEFDEISTRAEGIVVGAQEVTRYLNDGELIAEVTMEVPVERVVTTIKELHSQYYKGNTVTTTDITNITKNMERTTFRATGMGVPPAKFVQAARDAGYVVPPWMGEQLSVIGEGAYTPGSAQEQLKGRRAAELDGMRKLAEIVNGLRIDSSTTVRDFVTQHDEISGQVAAVIAGAIMESPDYSESGIARVRVTLPAAQVWSVVHPQMKIAGRR
jgi:hypothetical protein